MSDEQPSSAAGGPGGRDVLAEFRQISMRWPSASVATLVKPFRIERVISLVSDALRLRRAG